jgi:menaquinone-dependent protoporphyrinogen oxidase
VKVLVAYATHHGATREIAEGVGATLAQSGLHVSVEQVDRARDVSGYDAFVIGSALYCGWLKEATEFVRRNKATLAGHPLWLFSSGPLGTAATDPQGRDARATAVPKETVELGNAVRARDHQVFFGAYDPAAKPVGLLERTFKLVPNGSSVLQTGDFRDWAEIKAWAAAIAGELATDRATDGMGSTQAADPSRVPWKEATV